MPEAGILFASGTALRCGEGRKKWRDRVGGFLKIWWKEQRLEERGGPGGRAREPGGPPLKTPPPPAPRAPAAGFYCGRDQVCFWTKLRMASKLSALMTCSMRQASSAATMGSTPRLLSQAERKVCRS